MENISKSGKVVMTPSDKVKGMARNDLAEQKARKELSAKQAEAAVSTLMNAYGDELYRYCASTLGNDADAQDVLQVTFVQAFEGLTKFKGDASFRTWLYAIARHRCLDRLKMDRRLHARVQFTDEPPDAEDENRADCGDPGLRRALEICLAKLSVKVRDAVLMRFQAEMSYAEIADLAKEKAGTIQARVARALPVLRRCVAEHGVTL